MHSGLVDSLLEMMNFRNRVPKLQTPEQELQLDHCPQTAAKENIIARFIMVLFCRRRFQGLKKGNIVIC